MRGMKWKRRFRNTVYYLLAGLIPFLLAVAAYVSTVDIMYDEALTTGVEQLRHKQELMDSFLINVQSIGFAISNNPSMQALSAMKSISGDDISALRSAANNINIGNTIFDPIQRQVLCGYYVLFADSRVILNIRDRTAFLTDTWQSAYSLDGLTARQWYDLAFGSGAGAAFIPSVTLSINYTQRDVALYLQPVPTGSGNPRAMAVIAVDMNRFASLLSGSEAEGETTVLLDNGNQNLYPADRGDGALLLRALQLEDGESSRQDWQGRDSVFMAVRSAYTGWSALRIVPAQALAPAAGRLQLFISLSSAAIILFAVLTTVVAAYLNNKPIREISRMLFALRQAPRPASGAEPAPAGAAESRELDSIAADDVSYGVQQLIRLNRSIQGDLEAYRGRLRDAMLDRLLEGRIQREAEMEECARLLDGLFSHAAYAVMLLQIGAERSCALEMDFENIDIQRMAVLQHLISAPGEFVHAVHSADEIAVIALMDGEPAPEGSAEEGLVQRAADILAQLRKVGHVNVRVGIGAACRRPADLSRSMEQARTALFMADRGEQVILYDRQSHESADAYYYPLEEERRLIHTVRSGNEAETRLILQGIYTENFVKRKLRRALLDQLGHELEGTLTKLTGSMPPDAQRKSAVSAGGLFPDPVFDRLCGRIVGLCACFSESRHTPLEALVQQIMEYLETAYADGNLSLNNLADRFDISEAYLSRIFKEHAGENFTACLERIRLQHAQRMLAQTRIPIQDIVSRVGYTYYDTFRKAFKRFYGVTPGEYRSLALEKPGGDYLKEYTKEAL